VLANILISAEGNVVTATGTNMDQSITTVSDCTVSAPGSCCVNAKRLQQLARELPKTAAVTLERKQSMLTVTYPNGSAEFGVMAAEDFPSVQGKAEGATILLSSADFMALADKGGFCTATDRTRMALTGALLEVGDGMAMLVSTDGHRLSTACLVAGHDTDKAQVIIPATTLAMADRLANSEDLQKIVIGNGVIVFDFGDAMLRSKTVEGPYPNYRQVVPTTFKNFFEADTDELARAVSRTATLANAVTRQVRLAFSETGVELTANNADIGGEAREQVQGAYQGEAMQIGMNAAFLSEILRKVDTATVKMEMNEPYSACVIKPVAGNTPEFTALVMPLRLND